MAKLLEENTDKATLIRGGASSLITKILGAGITFATQIVTARFLGVEEYGRYVYVVSWFNIFVIFGKLGFDSASLRFVAQYNTTKQWSLLKGFLIYSNRTITLVSLTFISTVITFMTLCLHSYLDLQLQKTFLISLVSLPFFSLLQNYQQVLRALQKIVLSHVSEIIFTPGLSLILILFIKIFFPQILNAQIVIFIYSLVIILAFLLAKLWTNYNLPKVLIEVEPKYNSSQWLKVSLTMILLTGFSHILFQADTIMLGAIIGTKISGIYTVASKIASLLALLLVAANSILASIITKMYYHKKLEELQKLISFTSLINSICSIFVASIIIVFGKQILSLYGDEFISAYILLVILLVSQLVNALSGSVALILNMTGHQNDVAIILGISAITNIGLNYVLIPLYGATGAAIATMTTTILWNITMVIIVWKRLKILSLPQFMNI